MTDSKIATEFRGKLNKLIIELYHLDFMIDSPASNMTLGEYEQERERLLDEFVQAIAATRGSGECEIYRVGNTQDLRMCSACGKLMHFNHPLDRDCLNYCPNCGKAVKR